MCLVHQNIYKCTLLKWISEYNCTLNFKVLIYFLITWLFYLVRRYTSASLFSMVSYHDGNIPNALFKVYGRSISKTDHWLQFMTILPISLSVTLVTKLYGNNSVFENSLIKLHKIYLSINIITVFYFYLLFITFKNNIITEIHVNLHEKLIGILYMYMIKSNSMHWTLFYAEYNHTTIGIGLKFCCSTVTDVKCCLHSSL
jgi:hypothetical protein